MNATIRGLIHRQVSRDPQIAGMLAAYSGQPAFFYQKAPSDSRPGWGKKRYPRVDFAIDTQQDPERKTAGIMTVNIFVTTKVPQIGDRDPDRAIEQRLIELLSGTFYTDPQEGTCCVEWQRSDEFTIETQTGEKHPEVYGLTVIFDVLAFPPQLTTDPDPIQGLNRWTKDHFPTMTTIGYEALPVIFKPSDAEPAIYWRFEGTATTNRQSYAVTWYTGVFYAHIIADSVMERNRWIKAIIEKAQLEGEVILPDTSPMFINRIAVRHNADPLRDGQLELTGQYGVLSPPRKEPAQIKLNHAPTSMAQKEE